MSRMSKELLARIPVELQAEFSEASLLRGVDYYLGRRVESVQTVGSFLRGLVRGNELYEVQIERFDDGAYSFYCTCPYFATTDDGCKHIAAALMAAGAANHPADAFAGDGLLRERDEKSAWRPLLSAMGQPQRPLETFARLPSPQLLYRLDATASQRGPQVRIEVWQLEMKRSGPREAGPVRLRRDAFRDFPDPLDRRLLGLLAGGRSALSYGAGYGTWTNEVTLSVDLEPEVAVDVLPILCSSGRFALLPEDGGLAPEALQWNPEPWHCEVFVEATPEGGLRLGSRLGRGDERRSPLAPLLVTPTVVVDGHEISPLADGSSVPWLQWFRHGAEEHVTVPADQVDDFLAELLVAPNLPRVDLPPELVIASDTGQPIPGLRITTQDDHFRSSLANCRLTVRYGDHRLPQGDARSAFLVQEAGQRILRQRDPEAEHAQRDRLLALGFRAPSYARTRDVLEIARRPLLDATRVLIAEGWEIEIDGTSYRPAEAPRLRVSSGIDWFDITADDGGGTAVPFPLLLQALDHGVTQIPLADGSIAVLPDEWLERNRFWLAAGRREGDGVRFAAAQAALVEAWLTEEPEVDYDAAFGELTARLAVAGAAVDPPASFVGTLREYQREGLAWLEHLAASGLGGCLADDMGLGKTVQLLAFLDRRQRAASLSLVVAPKTLLGNWCAEAARFTPTLRTYLHTGSARAKSTSAFSEADVVVTSYDLLRRDLAMFGAVRWDTVVLDEAQAIKNPHTATAKAARQLKALFRVAATGTPVENHLGELWSLFEFLNPGLLGRALMGTKGGGRDLPLDVRERLARGLRPFLLRRTKAEVAPDLPPKTEQTVWCDLGSAQRRLYDELRDHYRAALTLRVNRFGMKRAAIQVLEALLRLRQAACHPRLLDRRSTLDVPSAKFEALLPRLAELREEGHKALVFSQFTSLLALLRTELDKTGVTYEYLDGQTEDRQERVQRFQTDPDCPLFLISLKAGGYGLNLTAAEYVFLLDPWWNPAVEAQAIDRTHRIGQERPVFAYRLIARGTVEERILELQAQKRELADAIFAADASPLAGLSREDLELLLG